MINHYNANKFCCEDIALIENYWEAVWDPFEKWECHHRLGIQSDVRYSKKELIAMDVYYGRPAYELIFLTKSEHDSLHAKGNKNMLGKNHTPETIAKISEANKGERNPMFGEHHTDEAKAKMSEAHKGKHPSEEARANMSEAKKGNKNALGHHPSAETIEKLSRASKGRIWFNNGVVGRLIKPNEPIPEGFVKGCLRKKLI